MEGKMSERRYSAVWPVRLRPADLERIKAAALRTDRSVGGFIRWAALQAVKGANGQAMGDTKGKDNDSA